jgi:hypothetical protein
MEMWLDWYQHKLSLTVLGYVLHVALMALGLETGA